MIITLLTDFGVSDTYVGLLKGAIYDIHPTAVIVDLTHAVEPQNVRQGAYLLRTAVPYLPADSVHVGVVDPGVGTARRPILLQTTHHGFLVGPDYGLFEYVLRREPQPPHAWVLDKPAYWRGGSSAVSATFHGRDIFAPVAAHLAHGVAPAALGTAIEPASLVMLPTYTTTPPALGKDEQVVAQGYVAHIDHFGNIQTDIEAAHLAGLTETERQALRIRFDWQVAGQPSSVVVEGFYATYGAVPPGTPLILISSSAFVEVGVNSGNAAQLLGVPMGATATVYVGKN